MCGEEGVTVNCRFLIFSKNTLRSLFEVFPYLISFLDPMEEDILQVVKYCTDLIEEKDLEKLDLVIKYMKR